MRILSFAPPPFCADSFAGSPVSFRSSVSNSLLWIFLTPVFSRVASERRGQGDPGVPPSVPFAFRSHLPRHPDPPRPGFLVFPDRRVAVRFLPVPFRLSHRKGGIYFLRPLLKLTPPPQAAANSIHSPSAATGGCFV